MEAIVSERCWTIEELSALPEDGYQHEIQGGLLISEPRPVYRHGRLMTRISKLLDDYAEGHDLGEVVSGDPGFVLARNPDTYRGPDVAFIGKDRVATLNPDEAVEGAPDLAVEILSPSNTPSAVHAKVADYLAAGARLVWVVDSKRRAVTVYETLLNPRCLSGGDLLDGGAVLPGLSFPLSQIFDR